MASLQPFFPLDCNFNERVTAKSGSESGNGSTMPFSFRTFLGSYGGETRHGSKHFLNY